MCHILKILSLSLPIALFSTAPDNQLWTSLEIEHDLTPRLGLELEQELRLKDDVSRFRKTFTEVSLQFRIANTIRCSGHYRLTIHPDRTLRSRPSLSGTLRGSLGLFSTKYRLKFQREFEPGKVPQDHVRNRVTLGYRLSDRLSPYIEGELFHLVEKEGHQYHKYRITVGSEIDLTKSHSIDFFYRHQEEVNDPNPKSLNIWGLKCEVGL